MNLLTHTCTSSKVARVAYDADARVLFIEFKPNLVCYRYEEVDPIHFEIIATIKADNDAWVNDNPGEAPISRFESVVPGSEGSYIIRRIVGTDRKNPLFKFRKLDPEEAGQVFPFVPTAAVESAA